MLVELSWDNRAWYSCDGGVELFVEYSCVGRVELSRAVMVQYICVCRVELIRVVLVESS